MTTLDTLARKHRTNVLAMGGTPELARVNRTPRHDGSCHVEPAGDGGWTLVVTERGNEWERTRYATDGALLYRLARDAAWRLASDHEFANRVAGQDSRRQLFARWLELVGLLSDDWQALLADEIDAILEEAPFADDPAELLARPHPLRGNLVGLGVIAALLLAWVLAHMPLWYAHDLERDLAARGVPLEASVTDSSTSRPKIGITHHIAYAFEVAGARHEIRETVSEAIGTSMAPGDKVAIRYDPDDPSRSLVQGNDAFARLATLYALIDAMLAFVVFGGIWKMLRNRRMTAD